MLPHPFHPGAKRTAPRRRQLAVLGLFARHRALDIVPFRAKRGAPLFVQATRRIFAFTACPSTSHHVLQKNSGAKAPEALAHRFRLNMPPLGRGAVTSMRERIGFHAAARTTTALARLAASVMHGAFAVNGADMLHMTRVVMHDMAAVLALGAAAVLALLGFGKDFAGVAAALGVVVKIAGGVIITHVGRLRLAVLHFAASLAVLASVMSAMNASGGDFMNAVVLVMFAVGHGPVP